MSFLNILFKKSGQPSILVSAKSDEMFIETAAKFINKAGITEQESVKFFFNSEELKLTSVKTLAELGLKNNTTIDVVVITSTFFGA